MLVFLLTQLRDMSVPKAIIFVAVLVAIIVGIILVANKVNGDKKYNDSRGYIQENPKEPPKECKVVPVQLGQNLIISCVINNDTWPNNTLPGTIKAIHTNPLLNVMVDCSAEGRNVTCKLGRANCSSRGRVDIKFSKNAQLKFTKSVTVQVKAGCLNTNITKESSVFRLSCDYRNDCDTYEMQFYGNGYVLTDPLECSESSYTDTDGHSMNCTAAVSETVIQQYDNFSELYCCLTNGQQSTFETLTCENFNNDCNKTTTT